jgi:hypothetical protein
VKIPYETEYKDSPTLVLREGTYPFSIGLAKAKLVIQYIAEIEQFVQRQEPNYTPKPKV